MPANHTYKFHMDELNDNNKYGDLNAKLSAEYMLHPFSHRQCVGRYALSMFIYLIKRGNASRQVFVLMNVNILINNIGKILSKKGINIPSCSDNLDPMHCLYNMDYKVSCRFLLNISFL